MRAARWLIPVGGAVVLVALFLVLRPEDRPDPSTSRTPPGTPTPDETAGTATPTETPSGPDALEVEIEVEEGRVDVEVEGQRVPSPATIAVNQGDRVSLRVEADVADQVHVHGYDLLADVLPDRRATITFRTDVPGVFEIELEDAGQLLAQLEVRL